MKKTLWFKVWIAFLSGCIAAFQIGKTIASLTLIINDLALSLIEAGLVLSLFSLIAAFAGAGFGLLADRVGHVNTAITGLMISACGSFYGSIAPDIFILLLSRLIEGFGFILAIVSFPSLISRSATDADRPLVMGLWGAFMPTGIGLSMLVTPWLLEWHSWRGLWNDIGIFMLLWTVILYATFRHTPKTSGPQQNSRELIRTILKPGPLYVVAGFVCYSSLYQSLTSFLPTILISDYGVAIGNAAHFGAFVVIGNIIGNLSAGWLIGRGANPWKLLTLSFIAMLICASLVFATFSDPIIKVSAGFLFSAFGGIFPGTAFVLAARFSVSPAQMALMAGLMLQGAGIGQTIGPLMVSSIVEFNSSWNYANLIVLLMTGVGLFCALQIRRQT
ncbi:MAG: CP family cyanate transporter-like MFS transporter [Gammaproteobacteria bacterium]|jgi:CP family cyanate transporter-like MFS transporter